ncbi:hypothetical protein [Aliarcobacter butzleri]|uniref:hypothetical protein n=1 Tax=Aliarcobacter butzleri TaxID=28197 RepID=UPI00263DDEC1|nr:hypothetical protein [Aliarcobacter butzleri]MDN5056979.1 hypothetical protein [Aliarcobacter butzleri]
MHYILNLLLLDHVLLFVVQTLYFYNDPHWIDLLHLVAKSCYDEHTSSKIEFSSLSGLLLD